MELQLSDVRITGAGIGYAGANGEEMSLSIHFQAAIGTREARQLGDGVYNTLYRDGQNGSGPKLNLIKKLVPGVGVPQATLIIERYTGANEIAVQGKVRGIEFTDRDGGVLLEFKLTTEADLDVCRFLLEQKKNPMPSVVVKGEPKGGEVQEELPLEGAAA